MTTALYAGTFDPITLGHIDIIDRSTKIFDKVVVGVTVGNEKKTVFSLEERVKLICSHYKNNTNLQVMGYQNTLTVDTMREIKASVLIRGLRSVSDFEYELQLTNMNRTMWSEYECIFLTPKGELSHISSSLVKEVATLGGDIDHFVPDLVARALRAKLSI